MIKDKWNGWVRAWGVRAGSADVEYVFFLVGVSTLTVLGAPSECCCLGTNNGLQYSIRLMQPLPHNPQTQLTQVGAVQGGDACMRALGFFESGDAQESWLLTPNANSWVVLNNGRAQVQSALATLPAAGPAAAAAGGGTNAGLPSGGFAGGMGVLPPPGAFPQPGLGGGGVGGVGGGAGGMPDLAMMARMAQDPNVMQGMMNDPGVQAMMRSNPQMAAAMQVRLC